MSTSKAGSLATLFKKASEEAGGPRSKKMASDYQLNGRWCIVPYDAD